MIEIYTHVRIKETNITGIVLDTTTSQTTGELKYLIENDEAVYYADGTIDYEIIKCDPNEIEAI